MNPAVVTQPVITKEFVAVMAVPVTMDGTTNRIVQVILVSIDTNLSCTVLVLKKFYEEESLQRITLNCFVLWRTPYTGGRNVWSGWFLAGNQDNHQSFIPSLISKNLWLIFMGMKQKNFFFEKQNSKWPTQKNWVFQNHQFSIFFFKNFMDWSLG